MPTVSVYIKKEDWNKWVAIKKPSEFIHNALNIRDAYKAMTPVEKKVVKETVATIPEIVKKANLGLNKEPFEHYLKGKR